VDEAKTDAPAVPGRADQIFALIPLKGLVVVPELAKVPWKTMDAIDAFVVNEKSDARR
jgi:hypothetical protein